MTDEEEQFFAELEETARELGRLASAPWDAAGNGTADRNGGPDNGTADRPSAGSWGAINAGVRRAERLNRELHDAVRHPSHYTDANGVAWIDDPGIECIEITRYMNFTLGNAVKYLWRAGSKGNASEDLRKAIQYIEFAIADLEESA